MENRDDDRIKCETRSCMAQWESKIKKEVTSNLF